MPLPRLERSARHSKAANDGSFEVTQSAGKLALVWDAQAEPYAAVLHVAADGRKMVVASGLTGGNASVDVSALRRRTFRGQPVVVCGRTFDEGAAPLRVAAGCKKGLPRQALF